MSSVRKIRVIVTNKSIGHRRFLNRYHITDVFTPTMLTGCHMKLCINNSKEMDWLY